MSLRVFFIFTISGKYRAAKPIKKMLVIVVCGVVLLLREFEKHRDMKGAALDSNGARNLFAFLVAVQVDCLLLFLRLLYRDWRRLGFAWKENI